MSSRNNLARFAMQLALTNKKAKEAIGKAFLSQRGWTSKMKLSKVNVDLGDCVQAFQMRINDSANLVRQKFLPTADTLVSGHISCA